MSETKALTTYLDFDITGAEQDLAKQSEEAEKESKIYWKHPGGERALRILPPPVSWAPWFEQQQIKPTPFILFWKHFYERPDEPGSWVSTPCPLKEANEPCPICREAARLRSTGNQLDDDLGWDMSAKYKCLINVIDRDDPESGPLMWEISAPSGKWKGRTMYERLRGLMTGRAARNLVTPTDQGFDLIITKSGSGRKGTSYTLQADANPSPLSRDSAEAARWIETQHDLRTFIVPPTREQIAAIASGEQVRTGSAERVEKPRAAISSDAPKKATDYIDTDADADDLAF